MKRTVDKTKESNIKCEHCTYANRDEQKGYWCMFHAMYKNYWNRCKEFKWRNTERIGEQK